MAYRFILKHHQQTVLNENGRSAQCYTFINQKLNYYIMIAIVLSLNYSYKRA